VDIPFAGAYFKTSWKPLIQRLGFAANRKIVWSMNKSLRSGFYNEKIAIEMSLWLSHDTYNLLF